MNSGKREVLAYRLDDDLENLLLETVSAAKFDDFIGILQQVQANYKTINSVKKIIRQLPRRKQKNWGTKLITGDQPIEKVIGAYLLEITEYYVRNEDEILEYAEKFAEDDDWNVRQSSSDLLEAIATHNDEYNVELIIKYLRSENAHFRRLALLTIKSITKSATYPDELKQRILSELDIVLAEDDPYVQTVSNDMFKEGYMKYCTEMTLNWLLEQAESTTNPQATSTILNVIGTRNVGDRIDQALKIIDKLLSDEETMVKKARSNALHVLSEKHHDRVASFLESRLHVKQAVDHWSELEADGTLNSFSF